VSADRSTETPASDQYDVPARAAGAAVTATWIHPGDARTTAGADARWVDGSRLSTWHGAAEPAYPLRYSGSVATPPRRKPGFGRGFLSVTQAPRSRATARSLPGRRAGAA
jgi:hypothetical protein